MKAFIRSTSWSYTTPDVVRVELELRKGDYDGMASMLAGDEVYINGESRWGRFISAMKKKWRGK